MRGSYVVVFQWAWLFMLSFCPPALSKCRKNIVTTYKTFETAGSHKLAMILRPDQILSIIFAQYSLNYSSVSKSIVLGKVRSTTRMRRWSCPRAWPLTSSFCHLASLNLCQDGFTIDMCSINVGVEKLGVAWRLFEASSMSVQPFYNNENYTERRHLAALYRTQIPNERRISAISLFLSSTRCWWRNQGHAGDMSVVYGFEMLWRF